MAFSERRKNKKWKRKERKRFPYKARSRYLVLDENGKIKGRYRYKLTAYSFHGSKAKIVTPEEHNKEH